MPQLWQNSFPPRKPEHAYKTGVVPLFVGIWLETQPTTSIRKKHEYLEPGLQLCQLRKFTSKLQSDADSRIMCDISGKIFLITVLVWNYIYIIKIYIWQVNISVNDFTKPALETSNLKFYMLSILRTQIISRD